MDTHDYLVSVDINVSLHKWNRLCQNVIACTNQVNIEHRVVPYSAEYPLIVVCSGLRSECNDDSCLGFCIDGSFDLRERKDIFIVGEKLGSCWEIAIIDDIKKPVCITAQLNLSKMDRLDT